MITGPGRVAARIIAAIPAALIVLFIGLLWLIGLACDEQRRKYVMGISARALEVVQAFFGGWSVARQEHGARLS